MRPPLTGTPESAALVGALTRGTATDEDGRDRTADVLAVLRPALTAPQPQALADALVQAAGRDPRRQAMVLELVAGALHSLPPQPSPGPEATARDALLRFVERDGPGQVRHLGRLPFVRERLLRALRDEATRALPQRGPGPERLVGAPGRTLAFLAVCRQLREAVSAALGYPVAPTYVAVHLLDPPRSTVPAHVDNPGWDVTFHLVLAHEHPTGGSALLVFRPGQAHPQRIEVAPGEGVVLEARRVVHAWEPLGDRERRLLVGIALAPSDAGTAGT